MLEMTFRFQIRHEMYKVATPETFVKGLKHYVKDGNINFLVIIIEKSERFVVYY